MSDVFEPFSLQTAIADSVTAVQKINGLTHIVFAETRPGVSGDIKERVACARIAIPNELVTLIVVAPICLGEGQAPFWSKGASYGQLLGPWDGDFRAPDPASAYAEVL